MIVAEGARQRFDGMCTLPYDENQSWVVGRGLLTINACAGNGTH